MGDHLVVNTSNQTYVNQLASLQQLRAHLRDNYAPILRLMSKDELIQLKQRDPLFEEIVFLSQELAKLSKRWKSLQ